jgi:hypothetical protein
VNVDLSYTCPFSYRPITQLVHLRCYLPGVQGSAIAQEVSGRLPTAGAQVRAQVRSCGVCSGQSGTGEEFLRVLQFPLPILIPPIAPHSSSSGTIGQLVADVPSGLSLTPTKETKRTTVCVRAAYNLISLKRYIRSKILIFILFPVVRHRCNAFKSSSPYNNNTLVKIYGLEALKLVRIA